MTAAVHTSLIKSELSYNGETNAANAAYETTQNSLEKPNAFLYDFLRQEISSFQLKNFHRLSRVCTISAYRTITCMHVDTAAALYCQVPAGCLQI